MKEEKLIEIAENFDEKDWPFSSSKIWKKIINQNPTALNLLNYANQLRLSGKFLKAEKVLKSINLSSVSENKKYLIHVHFGQLYEDRGKFKLAIKSYKKSLKHKPQETFPYIFLAVLYSQQSRLKKAEKILNLALRKEGDIDEVYYNLSTIYARKGNFEKAVSSMKECLKIDSDYSTSAKSFLADFENMLMI